MAITQNTFTGNGSNLGPFSFTFKWLEATDIKVAVGGVLKTVGTHYNLQSLNYATKNGGQVLFTAGNAPANGSTIRIYRDTDDSDLAATFISGSAIRARDLNDNFTQNLYVTQEVNNNAVSIDGSNPMVGDLNMGGYKITNLATPVVGTDAANRSFVEGVFSSQVPVFYRRWSKTAVGGETSLSGNDNSGIALSYVPGSEKVFINGALQIRGVDYLGTTGSTLTGIPALTAGDIVEVHSSSSYTVGTVPDGSVTNAKVDGAAAIQSTKLAFTQSGTGATTRTVESKLRDVVSVKDFGAVGDGVTDDTVAFTAACKAAFGALNFTTFGINTALSACVYVPPGEYNILSVVDTEGKDIVYYLDAGAELINADNINGRISRAGRSSKAPSQTRFGARDNAAGFSITVGKAGNDGAEVLGVTDENQVAVYADRDSTAVFVENSAPPPLASVTNCSFTATSVTLGTPLTQDQLKRLRVGMLIDTNHVTKYTGWITSWANDGTSISVENWYLVNGVAGAPSTPSSPATIYINPVTKIWGINANAILTNASHADALAVCEYGVVDNKAPSTGPTGGNHYAWGVDVVNIGSNKIQSCFVARAGGGGAFCGYRSDEANYGLYSSYGQSAVYSLSASPGSTQAVIASNGTNNLLSIGNNGQYDIVNALGQNTFKINPTGSIELGNLSASNTPFIDFHSSGNNIDYDVRFLVSGGSGTPGNGILDIAANFVYTNNKFVVGPLGGEFDPGSITLGEGTVSHRWKVAAGSGNLNFLQNNGAGTYQLRSYVTNNTGVYVTISDASTKNTVNPIDSALEKVNQLNPVSFYYNHQPSAETKSLGFIAQEVDQVYPEAVHSSEGVLGINYTALIPVLTKAIQELSARISELESRSN